MTKELVRRPVLTEKSVKLIEIGKYTFDVDSRLTKPQIKRLIEDLFQAKVDRVNTYLLAPKKRRLAGKQGAKSASKRAIITVKAGEVISLLGSQ